MTENDTKILVWIWRRPNRAARFSIRTPHYASGYQSVRRYFLAAGCWGKWILPAASFAANMAKSRTATVAVDAMTFRKPVYVGDVMCLY